MDVSSLLDPEIAAALEAVPVASAELTLDTIPAMRRRGLALPDLPLSDAVERTDAVAPGEVDVPLRVHRPKGAEGPLPCLYWIHGGGYVAGSHRDEDLRFDRWCVDLGCVGVAVDYRLAPETPYPGPLEDCYQGLRWVHEHAGELGVDVARTGIGGASAGGGLAAALALLARDRGGPGVAFQLLVYPMVDDRQDAPSATWEVPVWNPAADRVGWQAYLGPLYGRDDVPGHAVPARAGDLSRLPPAFVCVGTLDGFLDEDIEYAQRLMRAGVPTELHVYPGAPHGFDGMFNAEVSKRCRREIKGWLARQLGPAGGRRAPTART